MRHLHLVIIQVEYVNRRIDSDEQDEIQASNRQQNKREQTIQEVSQQLDQSQPTKGVLMWVLKFQQEAI